MIDTTDMNELSDIIYTNNDMQNCDIIFDTFKYFTTYNMNPIEYLKYFGFIDTFETIKLYTKLADKLIMSNYDKFNRIIDSLNSCLDSLESKIFTCAYNVNIFLPVCNFFPDSIKTTHFVNDYDKINKTKYELYNYVKNLPKTYHTILYYEEDVMSRKIRQQKHYSTINTFAKCFNKIIISDISGTTILLNISAFLKEKTNLMVINGYANLSEKLMSYYTNCIHFYTKYELLHKMRIIYNASQIAQLVQYEQIYRLEFENLFQKYSATNLHNTQFAINRLIYRGNINDANSIIYTMNYYELFDSKCSYYKINGTPHFSKYTSYQLRQAPIF